MGPKHFDDSSQVLVAKFVNKGTKEIYEFFVSKESFDNGERPRVIIYLFYPEGASVSPKFLVCDDCLALINKLRVDIDNWDIVYFNCWKSL